jgi:hypothetical protein
VLGYIADLQNNARDLAAMVLYLANQKYLRIIKQTNKEYRIESLVNFKEIENELDILF